MSGKDCAVVMTTLWRRAGQSNISRRRCVTALHLTSGQYMLSECCNPACRKKLHYLRSGRVVRILKKVADRTEVEHFWLCGACFVSYDFCLGEDGTPSLTTKSSFQIATDLAVWLDRISSGDISAEHFTEVHLSTPSDKISTVWRQHSRSR
jgi:hypothetical protein